MAIHIYDHKEWNRTARIHNEGLLSEHHDSLRLLIFRLHGAGIVATLFGVKLWLRKTVVSRASRFLNVANRGLVCAEHN